MNYKIKVNSEEESKEAQELFFELGYKFLDGIKLYNLVIDCLFASDNGFIFVSSFRENEYKEITLPELRDLVVLKRSSIDDATHENIVTGSKVLQVDDKNYYWQDGKWNEYPCGVDIKPIEKLMKEYLRKNSNGTYSYIGTVRPEHVSDFMIEIPGGAIKATLCNEFLIFWKDDFLSLSQKNGDTDFTFDEKEDYGFVEYMDINDDAKLIWNRETLNDKVASAECFRKSFVPNSNEIAKAIVSSLNDEDKFLNEVEPHLIDNVNHPPHYASGEIECIDAMRAMLGREQFIGYIRGNMFKYQWRYQNKNGIEDLKKSEWYLNKLLEVENEL